MDRVAFLEEVWTVVQSYGTQSILKLGLNRPLMREVFDKLDECEGRLSELLIDSATDENEANSPIKISPQEDKRELVYLSRTRKGTMRSQMVIDRNNEVKMKLGSKVRLRLLMALEDKSAMEGYLETMMQGTTLKQKA